MKLSYRNVTVVTSILINSHFVSQRLLRSFTGWRVLDVSKVLITKWGHDSNVYGSYTFIPKGVNGTSNQKALAAPLPPQAKASDITVSKFLLVLLPLTPFILMYCYLFHHCLKFELCILETVTCFKKKTSYNDRLQSFCRGFDNNLQSEVAQTLYGQMYVDTQ